MTTNRLFQTRTCIVAFLLISILLVPSCLAALQRTITVTSSSATVQANGVDSVNVTAKYLDESGKPQFEDEIILELGDATSSVRSGFTPDPAMGGFGPNRTSTITLTTDEKGCVTTQFGGVMPEFGNTTKWIWAYSAMIPTVYGKKAIDPTYPKKVNIKATPPSIIANSLDRTTITVQVFDNKGKPFNDTRLNMMVDESPWDCNKNGEFNGWLVQYVNNIHTNRNGMASLTFGWVRNTSKGSSSTIKAYLTDYPALTASTEVKFLAEKLPGLTTFAPKSASQGFYFIFTAGGSGLRYDDRIVLKKGTREITSQNTWTESVTKLYGQINIPWDAETGNYDVLLQRKNPSTTEWETWSTLTGKFLVEK